MTTAEHIFSFFIECIVGLIKTAWTLAQAGGFLWVLYYVIRAATHAPY